MSGDENEYNYFLMKNEVLNIFLCKIFSKKATFTEKMAKKFMATQPLSKRRGHLTPKNEYNLFYHKLDAKYIRAYGNVGTSSSDVVYRYYLSIDM